MSARPLSKSTGRRPSGPAAHLYQGVTASGGVFSLFANNLSRVGGQIRRALAGNRTARWRGPPQPGHPLLENGTKQRPAVGNRPRRHRLADFPGWIVEPWSRSSSVTVPRPGRRRHPVCPALRPAKKGKVRAKYGRTGTRVGEKRGSRAKGQRNRVPSDQQPYPSSTPFSPRSLTGTVGSTAVPFAHHRPGRRRHPVIQCGDLSRVFRRKTAGTRKTDTLGGKQVQLSIPIVGIPRAIGRTRPGC